MNAQTSTRGWTLVVFRTFATKEVLALCYSYSTLQKHLFKRLGIPKQPSDPGPSQTYAFATFLSGFLSCCENLLFRIGYINKINWFAVFRGVLVSTFFAMNAGSSFGHCHCLHPCSLFGHGASLSILIFIRVYYQLLYGFSMF